MRFHNILNAINSALCFCYISKAEVLNILPRKKNGNKSIQQEKDQKSEEYRKAKPSHKNKLQITIKIKENLVLINNVYQKEQKHCKTVMSPLHQYQLD